MIEQTIENWHKHLRGEFPGGLDVLLTDDVVFYSPVVYTPQKGKAVTKLYLQAAGATFGDVTGANDKSGTKASDSSDEAIPFHYTKEVLLGHHAVLEFEATMGGTYLNGVDIISCNDEGKIVEFRVMLRPLQAVNMMHQRMQAMLAKMQDSAPSGVAAG